MQKRQPGRVEGLPFEMAQNLNHLVGRAFGQSQTPPIDLIADQRVAAMREMDANLMRTTCLQNYTYICMCREAFDHRVMRHRWLALGPDTHTFAINRMPTDWLVNRTAAC